MGDKGGKKNKEKNQKQKTAKHELHGHKKDQQMMRTVEVKNSLFGSHVS